MFNRVREQLLSGSVWQDRDCVDKHNGLIHAIRSGDAKELADEVFACLTDESPTVRESVLQAIGEVARFIGAKRLAALPFASMR